MSKHTPDTVQSRCKNLLVDSPDPVSRQQKNSQGIVSFDIQGLLEEWPGREREGERGLGLKVWLGEPAIKSGFASVGVLGLHDLVYCGRSNYSVSLKPCMRTMTWIWV